MKPGNTPRRLHMGCGEGLSALAALQRRPAAGSEKTRPPRSGRAKTGEEKR